MDRITETRDSTIPTSKLGLLADAAQSVRRRIVNRLLPKHEDTVDMNVSARDGGSESTPLRAPTRTIDPVEASRAEDKQTASASRCGAQFSGMTWTTHTHTDVAGGMGSGGGGVWG